MAEPISFLRPAWSADGDDLGPAPALVGLDDLTAAWAWGGSTGEGVKVAIVDSGIEADHPDLAGCVDVGAGVEVVVTEAGTELRPGPHPDAVGHGTACAGIVHSLAPGAALASVKVLSSGNTGRAAGFLAGLRWAVEAGFGVINLSLGTGMADWTLPFYELCDAAYFADVFVVTAASNLRQPSFPSLYGTVTSVACNTSADPWEYHVNPRPPTEFLARGIDVEAAWKGRSRVKVTGNSFAAPHLSGIAALIRSKHPALRPFQIKTILAAAAANSPAVAPGRIGARPPRPARRPAGLAVR